DPRPERAVEAIHDERGVVITKGPARGEDGAGARGEERAGKAQRTFAGKYVSAGGLAGRQHDQASAQIERRDLARLEPPILCRATRRQEHRGAIRKRVVGARVSGKVEDGVTGERRGLEELLRGVAALADVAC